MANEIDLKVTLDRIDSACEEQLRCAMKALMMTERLSPDMVQKALDLANYVRMS